MKHLSASTLILALPLLLFSCAGNNNNGKRESQKPEKELKEQAIRSYVKKKGETIARSSQKALASKLKTAIDEGGVSNAIEYCKLHAYPIIDSLKNEYGVSIKRASHRLRNPADAPDKHEEKILSNYVTTLEQGHTPEPVVKQIDDHQLLYAEPIVLNKPLCLNCHGEVGKQLSRETFKLIKKYYPNDSAHNHQLGDLRGIWSIKFNKEKVKIQ